MILMMSKAAVSRPCLAPAAWRPSGAATSTLRRRHGDLDARRPGARRPSRERRTGVLGWLDDLNWRRRVRDLDDGACGGLEGKGGLGGWDGDPRALTLTRLPGREQGGEADPEHGASLT